MGFRGDDGLAAVTIVLYFCVSSVGARNGANQVPAERIFPVIASAATHTLMHSSASPRGAFDVQAPMSVDRWVKNLEEDGGDKQLAQALRSLKEGYGFDGVRLVSGQGACLPLCLHTILAEALARMAPEAGSKLVQAARTLTEGAANDAFGKLQTRNDDQNRARLVVEDYSRTLRSRNVDTALSAEACERSRGGPAQARKSL